ncbi:MAG: hypothetical protein J6I41_09085 [Bacteroidales bacterium]|nr:hypothetical protein [Bacteroidales bacterium]
MKKTILFATLAVLVVNILAGLLLSSYHTFNMLATSLVIVLTTTLMYITEYITMKDAFRVSLPFVFAFLGLVMFLLMLFSKHQLQDNWCVAVSLVLLLIEALTLFITHRVSTKFINQ